MDFNNYREISLFSTSYTILTNFHQERLHMQTKLCENISVGLGRIDPLSTKCGYLAFGK